MRKNLWIKMQGWVLLALGLMSLTNARGDSGAPDLKRLERSFSIHASLSSLARYGHSGANFVPEVAPSEEEIRNAARLLTSDYAANRLYLIYQHELSVPEIETTFRIWRQACPPEVALVPALILRANDTNELFSATELRLLSAFFEAEINPGHLAVFDNHARRDQGRALTALASEYGHGLIRLGLQADEPLSAPFVAAVEDTWSAICLGKSNTDWAQPAFGQETLRKRVQNRNESSSATTWNLIIAAWDYSKTAHGEYPGYDDAQKNMPLPSGRNALAATEILRFTKPGLITGFSSDLQALQANSRAATHDGLGYSFYEMLKQGHIYVGYYARPFHEVVKIYQSLRLGKMPERP
jgi:hypothetical protein